MTLHKDIPARHMGEFTDEQRAVMDEIMNEVGELLLRRLNESSLNDDDSCPMCVLVLLMSGMIDNIDDINKGTPIIEGMVEALSCIQEMKEKQRAMH